MEKILILLLSLISSGILFKKIFDYYEEDKAKLLSQKKSGEVILGQIVETIAPIIDSFPIKYEERKDLVFLGMPIDFIHFGEEGIMFIEIKSGKATLSTKQRQIKKLIEEKKVSFVSVQIPQKQK